MELEVSTIIDISDLKRSERIKYVKDFLEGLMELPRQREDGGTYWKPCLVVLDEAHLLAGQQEKQDSCSAVIDLMTRGRNRGYCGILCTQRISKLHKDAVAEANNIMIGRTGLDIDMKRASEILGFTSKQDMLTLRDLEAGEFYVFGTAISRHVTKAFVGEVKTTHPKVGMDLRKEIIKPTENIIKILSKIKDLPQEAENELIELNDYKKEVMELKRQIRVLESSKPKPEIDVKQLERAREQGYKQGIMGSLNEKQTIKKLYKILEKKLTDLGNILGQEIKLPKIMIERKVSGSGLTQLGEFPKPSRGNAGRYADVGSNPAPSISNKEFSLNLCERKIYSLLFQYSERSFTKSQIGVFTGYSYRSGGFNNAISHLRQLGLIEGSGNYLKAREIDLNLAHEFDFSKESIISKLNKCEREIYNVLLNNPEATFGKEELAESTETQYSPNSGGFNNAMSRLNTLGLIQRTNGMIRLNPELLEIQNE